MITEGIVALIWAAIGMAFYKGVGPLNEMMVLQKGNAAYLVNEISNSLLGRIGGALALLGVVAAPITSGDTAFRGARLIVADFLKLKQGPIKNRLMICVPMFIVGYILTQVDFAVIWRYFAWSNQTLGMMVLWTITVYLAQEGKLYWITLIPALFMTVVISSYLLFAPEGFALSYMVSVTSGLAIAICAAIWFFIKLKRSQSSASIITVPD
jgi:carbon starvation protein CstA